MTLRTGKSRPQAAGNAKPETPRKALGAAIALGVLAGCAGLGAPPAPTPAGPVLPPGGAPTCDAARYEYLVGQKQSEIDRGHLPSSFRMICMGCMATMDYAPNRLTIQLGPGETVASVRCG